MKKLIVLFLAMLGLNTIINDLYTYLGYDIAYKSNVIKYAVVIFLALTVFIFKKREQSAENSK
ncbi:MAG: hypothetical protein IT262_04175 [Saprospiraceae bacterium]|nr:hypothetical protein [Saprospiraceae bacterium]